MKKSNSRSDDLYTTASSTSDSLSSSSPDERSGLLDYRENSYTTITRSNSPPTSTVTSTETLQNARRMLYVSHFFNQFSEQTWQFCLVLFLAAFSNYESLILVTSYGLVSYSFVCAFGSTAGRFIDGSNRLQVARQFIGFENCAVLLATWLCYVLLSEQDERDDSSDLETSSPHTSDLDGIPTDPKSILLLIGIHLLGAIALILDSGFRVAVERDWIVVMSQCAVHNAEAVHEQTSFHQVQKDWLSDTNVSMRQIDLSCKIVAPAVAGFFIAIFDDGHSEDHGYDLRVAALLVGGLNALALVVEWVCTRKIYYDIPDLAFKSQSEDDRASKRENETTKEVPEGTESSRPGWQMGLKMPEGLDVYFHQAGR